MKIKERTEAARWVYEDSLRSHKGFMKTFKALTSAAKCFFNSRKVRNWQEVNIAAISRAPTSQDSVDTNIHERTAIPPDMQAELKSVFEKRALNEKSQGSDSEFEGKYDSAGIEEDDQEESVSKAKRTTKQSQSPDNLIPGSGEERLTHQAAFDKMKVRPPNRRPPTRNPGRH